MFRASMEYNMCLFSVVGSDRKLKITPQGQYEEQNLILGANKTHGVVQGQHGVQHVPLTCGGKWYEVQNAGSESPTFTALEIHEARG